MPYDHVLVLLADYIHKPIYFSDETYKTAHACLADALGCAFLTLRFPECTKLLGPVVPGTIVPDGSRVPGTNYVLDPIRAAFNIGTMIRWLDFNDTWLAAEWGHPSDNLGGILAIADYLSRSGQRSLTMHDVFTAMIKAYEIQGQLALKNSFNQIGFDHVILVKVATTGAVSWLLGLSHEQTLNALSNAFVDAGPLRTYRHAPNTGSRKSWAAGDATSRGTQFALMAQQGEMGYASALSAKKWGLYDVLFKGKPFEFPFPLGSYVMENILFKISYPAEFHAQTAVEAAVMLHPQLINRWDDISSIEIKTHDSAIRIIDKTGVLKNPADRDHCLQYMVAIGLLHGTLAADHYEDAAAQDPRIDVLRQKMTVKEHLPYSKDYHDPQKRSIANAITIKFNDGTALEEIAIEYPIGHKRRRQEGLPLLWQKLHNNLNAILSSTKAQEIYDLLQDPNFVNLPVHAFMDRVSCL